MPSLRHTQAESKLIENLVKLAARDSAALRDHLDILYSTFSADAELGGYVHSMKSRVKDPEHLRDKLQRKLEESKRKGELFHINEKKPVRQNQRPCWSPTPAFAHSSIR